VDETGTPGAWALVDLGRGRVEVREPDPEWVRAFLGGRGLGAHFLAQRAREAGVLAPADRIVLGGGPLVGTRVPTASRASATFISPLTRSLNSLAGLPSLAGLLTHSSLGGSFAQCLAASGISQLILDGRSEVPVRLELTGGEVRIREAEPVLFEGATLLRARALDARLRELTGQPRASSVYPGPAGWAGVPYACLSSDGDRHFGRGGAGAIFAAKNLVGVSAWGRAETPIRDPERYRTRLRDLEAAVAARVRDPGQTASFRPRTGTTWWLDRAFQGGYLGREGGYLPWRNYDEGHFDPEAYNRVGTGALLALGDRSNVCHGCREVLCARLVRTTAGERRPRPEFESAALFINCGVTDLEGVVALNDRCNELGLDTMTAAAVLASALELRDLLDGAPEWGDVPGLLRTLEAVAHGRGTLGRLLARNGDDLGREILARHGEGARERVLRALTTAGGGLGYAGIQPKAFPGMAAAYATSSRGRGDHTAAWTVQAEEAGLADPRALGALVAAAQWNKAVVDSLGLCDFLPADVAGEPLLDLLEAVTGFHWSTEELLDCGRRIVALERSVNAGQGRTRAYDAHIPPKFLEPMTCGPLAGRRVDPGLHEAILDAYYAAQGWDEAGRVR
jgi:aldehyde:ferredoxin oxidoreductase